MLYGYAHPPASMRMRVAASSDNNYAGPFQHTVPKYPWPPLATDLDYASVTETLLILCRAILVTRHAIKLWSNNCQWHEFGKQLYKMLMVQRKRTFSTTIACVKVGQVTS